jgi:hypothetical protein
MNRDLVSCLSASAWFIPFVMLLPMRFWRRTGCRSFAASARASRESQAVPVALAHLECQGTQVFIQVMQF